MANEKNFELKGCYVALATCMKKGCYDSYGVKNAIDLEATKNLVDHLIDAQVTGILVAGTTGQSATLTHDEQVGLVRELHHYIKSKSDLDVIAGAGSNSTYKAISLSKDMEKIDPEMPLLHKTGYDNDPPQEGLIRHFTAIANSIKNPIIIYNAPSRTKCKCNIKAKTVIELARHPNIIGEKEASGDLKQVEEIIRNTDPSNFRVVSGEDRQVVDIIKMGGYGIISATANIRPRLFSKMTRLAFQGSYAEAYKLQKKVKPLIEVVFAKKNPIPLAHILNTEVRLPLTKDYISKELEKKIENVLVRCPDL